MRRALKNNGSPAPVFETDDNREYFTVMLKINPRALEEGTIQKTIQKTDQESTQKSAQKSAQKILDLIRQNNLITRAKIAQTIGLSDGGVKKQLKQLQAKGFLRRIGPDKGGHWVVVE